MASRDHPRFFDDVTALPPPPANLVELGKWIPHTVEFSVSTWVGIDSAFYEPPSEDVLAAYARPFLPVAPAGFPYAVEQRNPELFDRRAQARCRRGTRWRTCSTRGPKCRRSGSRSICRGRIEALILARRRSARSGGNDGRGVTRSPGGGAHGRRSRLHGPPGYAKVVTCSSGKTAQIAHLGAAA